MKKLLGNPKMLEEAKNSKPGHSWIVELLIFIPVFLVASVASSIPTTIGTVVWFFSNMWSAFSGIGSWSFGGEASTADLLSAMPSWLVLVELFSTCILTLITVLYCTVIEKRTAASMGFRKSHIGREYLFGASIGILMITAATVIGMVTGAYTVSWAVPDLGLLLLFLAGYILQGMAEETMCRGYLMVSMSRKTPVLICVLLSSLLFAALHLGNNGISALAFLNLFLSGLILAVYILKRGNIWGACALHTFWNYYQGCIYGISVSGSGSGTGSVFTAIQTAGKDLWSGGAFGIEGGLAVTIVEAAALLIILFLVPRAKEEQIEEKKEETPVEETPSETVADADTPTEKVSPETDSAEETEPVYTEPVYTEPMCTEPVCMEPAPADTQEPAAPAPAPAEEPG